MCSVANNKYFVEQCEFHNSAIAIALAEGQKLNFALKHPQKAMVGMIDRDLIKSGNMGCVVANCDSCSWKLLVGVCRNNPLYLLS